jgi:hypothetical protein
MPQPDTLYFDDGNGRIRQVPYDKLEIFKQYFPNATQADERALRQIEEERALRSEKEGKTKIPEIKLRQPDLTGLHGSVSLPENASIPEVAKDVLNVHRYDPEISFSAKYGAYKDNPELFRDRWEDTENVPLTDLAQKKYDQIKAKSRPKGMTPIVPVGYAGMPAKPQQEKPDELESLKDFLANTPSGRGFVEYDKKRKESFAQLDKQLDAEIANLEKEIKEKSSARQKLIGRGVPGTRYGVNPSWLPREERAKIDAAKAKDVEEADKIATQDDLDLAMKNLNELKMLQAAVKDKDRNAVSQFLREFGRRLPESLYNIGTLGIGDVIEGLSPKTGGPIASRSEDILSQYASLHQNDRTIAQDIAQGTTGSLEFMAQFAGAGGIAKGAAGAIGKGLLREGARQAAKQAATKGTEKVLKIAGKEVSESLLQTAIMPSTLATAIEKNAENPGGFLDSYANAFASNLVEVGSERVGQFIPGLEFKNLPPSIQKIRKATGIQGAGVEFLEEQFATAGHAMLGDEQAEWKDLVDPRKQLITAGVVGVIQLPYAAINAGGYAAAKHNDKKQKRSINQAYTNNLTNIQSIFGDEAKDVISLVNGIIDNNRQDTETISKAISGIATSNEFDEKQSDALIKYSLAYLAKNGLERGKSEEIQQVQKEAQETIQQTINPETNSIILAKIPGVEEPTFVQGNIVLHEDGSIDTHKSGEIYYTDSNGKRQVIDPKFVDIIENVPAEQAIEEATAAKTAEVVNRQANDEVRPYDKGEIIRFTSDGNISLMGQIQGVDDAGNYQVMVDGIPAPVIVEPRMIIDEDNLRGVDNGVQVDYTDEKGNIVTGTVDDMSLRNNGIIVIDEKEVPSVNVIGVHREEQAKQEEVDRMSEISPENEGMPAEQIEQNVTETGKEETKGQIALPEETEQPSGQDVEAEKQAFMQSLPIILEGENKGQIDQSRMTPEQNIKYFEYQYGTDKALRAATKMVDNLKERIKKEQAKLDADPFNIAQNDLVENLLAQQKIYQDYTSNAAPVREDVQVAKSAPDENTNIEPVKESVTTKAPADVPEQATKPKEKRQAKVIQQGEQQEQAAIDENMTDADRFLNDIEKQKEAIRQEVEKMTPKQREEWWGEPQSLREYIMRELINGQRILWSDTPTSKGFGSHLGMKGKEKERRKYIGLLGSAKTNALTPEAFAHKVWEDVVSKGGENEIGVRFHNVDTMGVLDEVLDVLYTHYSKGQMISDINESRLEQIFNELDMQAGVAMSGAWDIDPNERSQNEILLELRSEAKDDEISTYEIEEYYVNQVTQDEFYEYFYKFVANNNDYDETGEVGNNQQDAGEGSVPADGEGRDTGSSVDNEGAEGTDRADEREAETPKESASPIGYGQNDQGGRGQNAEGVAGIMQEGTAKSLKQRIKETDAELKKKQFAIIQASNPMKDDIHTGIRSADEILTAEEAFSPLIESGDEASPDFTAADMAEALKSGQITVYSSYPIANGVFVTPSRMMAEDYAGGKNVYSARVPINSVAWIDETEGQMANIDETVNTESYTKQTTSSEKSQHGLLNEENKLTVNQKQKEQEEPLKVNQKENIKKQSVEQKENKDEPIDILKKAQETVGGEQQRRNIPVITEEEYLSMNGAPFMSGSEPALHMNIQDDANKKKNIGRVMGDMKENNERREKLRKEYAEKVAKGEIRPPSRTELLIATAQGHPDNESTQAARRLLERQGINWERPSDNNLVVNEKGATLAKNKPNEKRKQKAINLQINWDEENGDVSAKRDEAFGADPETRDVQRKAGYDPAIDNRITNMERLLINRGHLDFVGNPLTGPVKITDANDVAFLFKNLERAQSENVFVVLAKDNGEYRVLYLTTGSSTSSIVDTKLIAPAAKDFRATKMWMVHNHPSGKLEPSVQDISVHRNLEQLGEVLGISVMPSIIINLDSGKYAKFSEWSRTTIDTPRGPAQGEPVRVDVYSFDRQMLYTPFSEKQKIKSSVDVARLLSQQKRGTVDKIHALIIDRANNINRYVLIDGNVSTDELNKILLEEVGRHGENVILSTNGIQLDFKRIKKALNIVGADLLDVITIKQDDDIINNYESLYELGLLADEQAGYEPRQSENVPGATYNGLMFHVVDEAGYYSTVEDALEKIKQEKGTPEQFKAMLLKNGAKQAELDWMGWDETFTGKSVTKAEIQDWINQNKIEISEVRKEKNEPLTEGEIIQREQDIYINADIATREKFGIDEPIERWDEYYKGDADEDILNEIAAKNGYSDYKKMFDAMDLYYEDLVYEELSELDRSREDSTKYSYYVLPGGEKYNELLLTMPHKISEKRRRYEELRAKEKMTESERREFSDLVNDDVDISDEKFRSLHFDEPNIVAHIRFDERTANGERILFLEEIQSDWAQQGKRHGFKTGKDKDVLRAEKALEESNKNLEKAINRRHELGLPVGAGSTEQKMFGSEIWLLGNNKEYIQLNRELEKVRNNKDYNSIQQRMEEIKKEYDKANSDYQKALDDVELDSKVLEKMKELSIISERYKVPDMPFKKTDQWITLAFRRMMRYAAENGYDRIAWTTGEQQADRYNLSKQVDRIVIDEENGQYSIMAVPKGGQELENIATATKENLSDYVGKEIALKAINEGGGDFRGDDLKVGGEGMRAFYDQIVPSVVKKISKPFGVDIETIELPETGAQQSIPVTDDMRGYAENGMPLFSIAQMSEDIDTLLNAAKTPQEKTKIVSDMVDELESRYRKSVDTVVLPTKKDVFESLRMMGADSELLSMAEKTKAKLNGVFFNGVIYLNSSSLDKAKNVAEVWAHENFHAWISDKKELLVPLINNLDDNFLNANLHAYYHKLDKEEKVNELLAFAVGRIFTGRDIARIKEADVILPVIIKYLDYVTEGEFSQSGARVRSGRKSDADALRDNQRGIPKGERINRPGEVSYQPQQEDGTVLPGYGGVSGVGGIAESAYAPMPRQKEGQSLEDYSREVSDWYFKQRELPNQPLFSVSDVADRTGSKMPEDLRKEYDVKYDRFFTRFREAWEDTFLPVKDFLDLLRKNGVEIAEYNDFYKQATHLQGKNDSQLKIFKDSYQHPITLAVSALVNKGFKYRDIENYVFAKHGIERNEYMRNAAIEEWENNHPEAEEDERAAFIKSLPNDYAGITALEEELGQPAEMFIDSFENKAGEEDINRLWAAINNATHWTLTKQYQTGMINKEVYDDLMNRYRYYVPLRGHDKETAEDRWDYTPDMGTFFTAPLVRAKGRRSRAESPFAFIEQMAHSAIVQGNKNTLKQSILRLAQKENGGLMSATKTWKVNIGTKEKPIWEQQSAPYSEDLDTYLQNQQLFEERMQQLKKEGMAYQGRARLDIGDLFIKPKQAEQHEIRVYQNGISYTVYINANPAIAKAINGANRVDKAKNMSWILNATRNMAANFTTRNPLFVMTNFSRDYIYSTTMLLAKETPEFMLEFQRNLPSAANALRRYERGNVDLNKKSDQYLYEYMINGGKTGFSHIFELDRVAKSLEREAQKGGKKNFADHARAIIDVIDMFNEVAENTTRLSVYITSREHGKSIIDSINDAKNITVNFNQKGAGSSVGKNNFEKFIFSLAGYVRPYYLFSNAAIQALSNIVKVTNKHPVKMAAILSSYALIGFISPLLAAMIGGDDGEDSYMKLSDWERQNNWCVLLPNGSFLKIPLPQELRIFSRMGDNIYQAYTGRKDILQVLMDTMFSVSDLLPMNPLGAAEISFAEIAPDFIRPLAQIKWNTNFMGSRIYNEWANKNMPGYLKARTNKKGEYYAPNFMVDWFMILDHLTGGDGVKKGVISLNPDITNHLLRGYFGGLYTIAEQGVGIASEVYNFTKTGELDIKVRETPLRAFYADKNDLQLQSSGISSRYYDIYDKVIESRRRAKAYTEKVQQGEMGIDEYSRVMSELNMPKINAIYDRIKEIKRIEREMKEMNPQQQKQAEEMIFDLRKEVVELNGNQ